MTRRRDTESNTNTPKPVASVTDLEERLAEGANGQEILGATIAWHIPSGILIPRERVRALLDAAGFASVKLPAIRVSSAMTRVLAEMAKDALLKEAAGGKSARVAKGTDNTDRLVYVLQRQDVDVESDDVLWATETRAIYRKGQQPGEGDSLTFQGPQAERLARMVRAYQDGYVSRDITWHILRATVKGNAGIALSPKGGAYFMHASSLEVARQLRAFVRALAAETGAACLFSVFLTPATAEAREDMAQAALRDLKSDLRDLDRDVREMRGRGEKAGKRKTAGVSAARETTLAAKEAQIAAALKKASLYMASTSKDMTQLTTLCASLRRELVKLQPPAVPDASREERETTDAAPLALTAAESEASREEREEREGAPVAPAPAVEREERRSL